MKKWLMASITILLLIVGGYLFLQEDKGQRTPPVSADVGQDVVKEPDRINVQDYGAKGDGKTDDTKAIQKAINDGAYLFFPAGTYLISETIVLDHHKVHGSGMENTVLMSKADAPIFKVQGSFTNIEDMTLQYEGWYQEEHPDRNAIVFDGEIGHSNFENLRLISVYRGFYILPSSEKENHAFSLNLRNIYVFNYAKNALHFMPSTGGLSGSVMENIYTHNGLRDDRYDENVIPYVFDHFSEVTLIQLNAEWSDISTAFQINDSRNVVMISPHIEGTDLYEDGVYFDVHNSNVKIMGADLINNAVHSDSAIFKAYGNSSLSVDGVHTRDTNQEKGALSIFRTVGEENNSAYIDRFIGDIEKVGALNGLVNNDGTPILKRYNDQQFYEKIGVHNESKLPIPSEAMRGMVVLVENNQKDELYICVKDGNVYKWELLK
ncbi:glycoside hydrolase family 55 protein [Pseudalkalibacillus hwajinpoensis]|uniref:glycoside hydrolase family 55 protein n=1 Tax=Guptibacillus hwajinpoensis TaxID=208199 RepID=UPI001F55A41A|nr:glycoside hydrolase family 55 protein [Pseudalkalibacillus hwajinpoensis]